MSGDTVYPGGVDTQYGAEADYAAGFWDDIDGSGTDFSAFMRRVESATINLEYYGTRVKGMVTGASIGNTSSATSTLASTITIPANFLRAGSMLEVRSRGVVTLNSGSPTLTFTAILGGVSYALGTTSGFTANASPHQYEVVVAFTAATVGASADIHASGGFRVSVATSNAFDSNSVTIIGGTSNTVDTTSAMTFDLKATMSVANAANTLISGVTTVTHIPFIG